jgi:putative sterol carrier protein
MKWNKYKHCYQDEYIPKHIYKDMKQGDEYYANRKINISDETPKYEETVESALNDFLDIIK